MQGNANSWIISSTPTWIDTAVPSTASRVSSNVPSAIISIPQCRWLKEFGDVGVSLLGFPILKQRREWEACVFTLRGRGRRAGRWRLVCRLPRTAAAVDENQVCESIIPYLQIPSSSPTYRQILLIFTCPMGIHITNNNRLFIMYDNGSDQYIFWFSTIQTTGRSYYLS